MPQPPSEFTGKEETNTPRTVQMSWGLAWGSLLLEARVGSGGGAERSEWGLKGRLGKLWGCRLPQMEEHCMDTIGSVS